MPSYVIVHSPGRIGETRQLREADLLGHYVAPVIWVTDAIPFVSYLTRGQ
jgi:hypothetical protein